MKKVNILLCLLVCLVIGSCQKKQDLVEKAFEDKNFDRMLPQRDEEVKEPEPEEPAQDDTKVEVLVDQLKPVQEETVFMDTGKAERTRPSIFKNDPEAPMFNLEDAPLFDIIRTLCSLLDVNYIIDPAVKDQKITINMVKADANYRVSDLFDLILKLHDLTMVFQGGFLHIVPISSPEVNPGLELLHGSRPNPNLRREELTIQIIPLKFVKPGDITSVAKEFLSPSARVYEEPKNNILIVIDKQKYLAKLLELIPIFDVDVLHNKKLVFYQLAHVDAVETTSQIQEILSVYGYEPDGDRLTLVPIETLNGILVVASSDSIFKELDFWVDKFDREAQFEEEQVFVYQVENTTAQSISGTLSQIFGLRTVSGSGNSNRNISSRRTTSPNLNPDDRTNRTRDLQQQNLQQTERPTSPQGTVTGPEDGPLMIIDEDNNSLIFSTTHREYSRIHKTLRKLDILPRQVFLEVTVLSVELTDAFEFGINWNGSDEASNEKSQDISGGFTQSESGTSSFGSAYSYVGLTGQLTATLTALKTKGYVNILQQPHIMAIDNKSASISVGADVPITTSRTNLGQIADGTGFRPAQSDTVQYRQTGVTLSFTPHINANGVIRLEITLDISEAGQQTSTEAVPISQNNLDTDMIVRDGQTVVMGGLIFNQEGWSKDTVPFLGRIPILKHLFTRRKSSGTKRELIIMITPRLIDSEEKSIAISKEFKEKILKEFETFKRSQY